LNKSLGVFERAGAFRKFCIKTSEAKWFETLILTMITVTSLALAFENPLNNPESRFNEILVILEYISTVIFVVEAGLKIVAFGFFFNGDKSYIK